MAQLGSDQLTNEIQVQQAGEIIMEMEFDQFLESESEFDAEIKTKSDPKVKVRRRTNFSNKKKVN